MKKIVNKVFEKIRVLKIWLEVHHVETYAKIPVFALIAFLWIYLMTGSLKTSLVHLMSGFVVAGIRFILLDYPRLRGKSIRFRNNFSCEFSFVFVSVVSFCATLSLADELVTLVAAITWILLYISFARLQRLIEWVFGGVLPFCILLYAEYMQDNLQIAGRYLFKTEEVDRFGYALGLLFIIFVTLFFRTVFNNKRIGYYVAGFLFGLLSIVNFFVCAYTAQPFTLSDIKIAATAAGVMKAQAIEFSDWIRFAIGMLLLGLYFVIVTIVYKRKQPKQKTSRRIISTTLVCAMTVAIFFMSGFLGNKVLLYQGHIKYGFIGNFYFTMTNRIDIPRDAKDYVIEDRNDPGDYAPNVIIIMNEAFSDLEATFDISLSEDPLKYFHELQDNYPHGITYSSVKGNNTCSSEWELLSGSPTALTAKGAMIYKDIDNQMRSIVSLFNSRGYETLGMHPYYGFGYNRDNVYRNLGFDQIVFIESMDQDLDKYRGFVTDEENYKLLIEKYEENEAAGDDPFFCFNITMQNHGAYKTQQDDTVYIKGGKKYSDVNTYLSGLRYSDEALKMLLSYFERVEEDTIILIFGDHQPLIDNIFYEDVFGKSYASLTLDELKDVYATPYLIWANYDLNHEAAPETTSNCYLTNILFEVGGIPKSTWLNMVNEYQKSYPVITEIFALDHQGKMFETRTLLQSKKGLPDDPLNLYQKYSYGILCGTK